jgi:hypothetical protein
MQTNRIKADEEMKILINQCKRKLDGMIDLELEARDLTIPEGLK